MTVIETLRTLCEAGNREVAQTLLDRACEALDERTVDACERVIEDTLAPARAVYFPVWATDDDRRSHLCRVEVGAPGTDDVLPEMDRDARDALEEAIRDAMHFVEPGGGTPRPSLALRATRALEYSLRGPSLYLAVFLAVLAYSSDSAPPRSVVATGHPRMHLGDLDGKRRVLARSTLADGTAELLAMDASRTTRQMPATEEFSALCWVSEIKDAVQQSFNIIPWASTAQVLCAHVYVGHRSEPPRRFRSRATLRSFTLHDRSSLEGREDLERLVALVFDELQRCERVELSVGGPVALAAALGWRLRNQRPDVNFIDANGAGKPWWSNKARLSLDAPEDEPSCVGDDGEARIVVSRNPGLRLPTGWHHLAIRATVGREDLPTLCRRVLHASQGARRLHLAFDAPLGVAWAVGGIVRNRFDVRFYQYQQGAYVPWFEGPQGG